MKVVEKRWCGGDNDILVTYTGESRNYKSARLMYIEGKQDARPGTVGTIVSPKQAKGVIIDSDIPDVKSFSFTWRGKLRQLLVKIRSEGGQPSSCTIKLVRPHTERKWKSLSGNVSLGVTVTVGDEKQFTPFLFNPHALAEWGDVIYLIDYESQEIVILGADELEGMAGNYTPLKLPFDLSGVLNAPNARGQALIVLGDNLYALYLRTGMPAVTHNPGILVRLAIESDGNLSYDDSSQTQINNITEVGRNPQSIIPVNDGAAVQLLVPAIGGYQASNGTTNSTYSNICCVPALGTWPAAAPVLITGDAGASPVTAYDIHAVAAGTRGRSNMLYILTQIYMTDSTNIAQNALWKLYKTTVGQFLDLGKLPNVPTLSTEVTAQVLDDIDEGVVTSVTFGGVYFWDLLYCQTDDVSDAGDLLWAALGTPILVTRAAEGGYGAPDSEEENAYIMFGFNGGNNVNAIDLTIEAINEAKRGGLSLKRALYGSVFSNSSDGESK